MNNEPGGRTLVPVSPLPECLKMGLPFPIIERHCIVFWGRPFRGTPLEKIAFIPRSDSLMPIQSVMDRLEEVAIITGDADREK